MRGARVQLALLLGCAALLFSQPCGEARQTAYGVNPAKPFTHEVWDDLLQTHVDANGFIHFSLLKAWPRMLNRYLDLLANASPVSHPDRFPSWRHELAYWLNARNALLLRYTLNAYPVEMPRLQAEGLHAKYHLERLGGRTFSLPQLDEMILSYQSQTRVPLRPALTLLSLESTPMPQRAYQAETLEEQLYALASAEVPYQQLNLNPQETCYRWVLQKKVKRAIDLNVPTYQSLYFPPKAVTGVDILFPAAQKPILQFCERFNPPDAENPPGLPSPMPPPYLLMDVWQIHPAVIDEVGT